MAVGKLKTSNKATHPSIIAYSGKKTFTKSDHYL